MAMQIVTGYTGTAHIKSAHDRSRNAGVVGKGSYVLSTGNMLAAKMQTANTLRIVDGDLMLQGTHATIEAGTHEDLAIDNGTQGMKRNDLVVARYERLSGEPKTESVTLRVIKGSPSSGAAADPAHVEGDVLKGDLVAEMPLYRVPIDGITPGKPVPLFDVAPTIDELRDSLSQTPRVFCGSKVIRFNNGPLCDLFSDSEFRQKFGRAFDHTRDSVSVMNGAYDAYAFPIDVVHSENRPGVVTVLVPTNHNSVVRVNYIVTLSR